MLFRELGDTRDIAACLSNQAGIARDRGDLDRATAFAQESLALFHELADHRGIAACLELIGSAIAAQGQPERATRLLAAAETVRETTGIDRPAARGAEQERTVAALRSALGADAFARAWEAGRRLPLDEIVADALTPAEPAAPPIPPSGTRPSPLTRREARGGRADCARPDQSPDRRGAVHRRADGRHPRRAHPGQARARLAHPGRDLGGGAG